MPERLHWRFVAQQCSCVGENIKFSSQGIKGCCFIVQKFIKNLQEPRRKWTQGVSTDNGTLIPVQSS